MTEKKKTEKKTTVQTVRMDCDLHKRMAIYAIKSEQSHQEILLTALLEYLKKHGA